MRGKGGGGRGARQCILSPLSPVLPAICSPITHTVYMLLIRSVSSILSLPPPPLSQSDEYGGYTALIYAAQQGNYRSVEILIKADPSGDHLNIKVG